MIQLLLFSATLALLIYGFTSTIKKDNKRILLHRLSFYHKRMEALYARLEELIFLRDYSAYTKRDNTMSYDLYLAGIKKQNEIFDKEMRELRTSKFDSHVEQYYTKLLNIHDKEVKVLESEIYRAEHTRLLHLHVDKQWSA